jgi:acetylcholinesterase
MTLTMLPLTVLSLLVSGLASASPLLPRQMATSNSTLNSTTSATINATVTLPNSSVSVVGTYYSPFAQDVYLGIPFAQPPVGALRFSAPIAPIYNSSNTTIIAQQQTPACSQIPTGSLASTFGVSEDCLTLNVYAPHGLNSTANLPVMVWIYGGGFIEGTSASFNATALVGQSIIETQPIIFVAVQYRVGIWGFAQGIQAATNNATNLGLRDQVLALEWVQSNIAAFGGDPTKVVVAGESAGAISIALHYLNPALVGSNGSNTTMNSTMSNMTVSADSTMSMATSLFRGAIMESGAMSTYPLNNASISRQTPFDQIANLTGCTANATANATMGNMTIGGAAYNQSIWNCLKYVNNMTLLNATIQVLQMPENQYG